MDDTLEGLRERVGRKVKLRHFLLERAVLGVAVTVELLDLELEIRTLQQQIENLEKPMPMPESSITPLVHCPYCGKPLDRAADAQGENAIPKEGDVSLCFGCGEFLVFETDLTVRKPTDDEIFEIGLDEDCQKARTKWVYAKRLHELRKFEG